MAHLRGKKGYEHLRSDRDVRRYLHLIKDPQGVWTEGEGNARIPIAHPGAEKSGPQAVGQVSLGLTVPSSPQKPAQHTTFGVRLWLIS